MRDKSTYYKRMFIGAAVWNWGGALPLCFAHTWTYERLGMTLPPSPVFDQSFAALVFVFGLGYLRVSHDLRFGQEIVRLGSLAKLLLVITHAWWAVQGNIPLTMLAPGIIDMIFVLLFFEYLRNGPKPDGSKPLTPVEQP